MRGMSEKTASPRRARLPWPALVVIALAGSACVTALALRAPLRARYWAWRVVRADTAGERARFLGAMCNLGDAARWGVASLLSNQSPTVRQYGVLVLHHVHTPWARKRLLDLVADADAGVRRLAAAGLAIHGDESVVPTLRWLYQSGDDASAATACVALARLATPDAIATLVALAYEPSETERRAALIDALSSIATPACAPALLHLLSDDRPCDRRPWSEEVMRNALSGLQAGGYAEAAALRPTTACRPRTIAERAAEALAQISGLAGDFGPDSPAEDRERARKRWQKWFDHHQSRPSHPYTSSSNSKSAE